MRAAFSEEKTESGDPTARPRRDMKLRVVHETSYVYDEPITTSHHELHLTPRDGPRQTCLSHEIMIVPIPAVVRERIDYFRNRTSYFGLHEPHRSLRIVAKSEVRVLAKSEPLPLWSSPWEEAREYIARNRSPNVLSAYGFVFDSPYVKAHAELLEYALPSFAPRRPFLESMLGLTKRIFTDFTYDRTATQISTPLADVLRHRRGVCQDFAHLEIGCLRSMGLPARYVSGYLLTLPPPGKPRLVGADASHAWISTYFPNFGWIDFDPANNVMQPDSYVTMAYGRDFGDVTPVRGVILGGGRHRMRVSVDVSRVPDREEAKLG